RWGRSRSPAELADDQRVVLAAEAEGVAEAGFDAAGVFVARLIGDVVQVALGVGRFKIDRRRQVAGTDGLHAGDEFDGAGRGDEVAEHALDAGDGDAWGEIAEDGLDAAGFDLVVFFGAG